MDFGITKALANNGINLNNSLSDNISNFLQGKTANVLPNGANPPYNGNSALIDPYGIFYNNLITTVNNIPIKPLWMAFFDDALPIGELINYRFIPYDTNSNIFAAHAQGGSPFGALFAHGINIPGENNDITRVQSGESGFNGFLGGLHSTGRAGGNNLKVEISFLETNYSFTDFLLRPWSLAVATLGLKQSSLKVKTLECWQFTKTPQGFIPSKKYRFYNVAPIGVDSQQYDYEASKPTYRQVTFIFDHYDVVGGQLIDEESMFSSLLGRFFNNITPSSLVDKALSTAQSVITNFGNRVVTNVAGNINDITNNAINNISNSILNTGNKLGTSVSDTVNNVVDNIVNRGSGNSDTPQFNNSLAKTKVSINNGAANNQTPNNINSPIKNQIVKISTTDRITRLNAPLNPIPATIKPYTEQIVNIKSDDIAQNTATPDFTQSLGSQVEDTPRFTIGLPNTKIVDSNDSIKGISIPVQIKNINDKDNIKGINIPYNDVTIKDNDTTNPNINTQIVTIDKDDNIIHNN